MEFSSQTASLLSDIVEAARSTMESAKQISLSTQQQKTANSQVVTALREIVQGREVTSTTVDALDQISHELTDLSGDLEGTLSEFGFKREGAAPPALPALGEGSDA